MKRSLFFRIFTGYFLVIFLLAACILFFSFRVTRRYYLSTLTDDLKAQGTAVAIVAAPLIEQNRTAELSTVLRALDQRTHCRITVIAAEGNVLADSQQDHRRMENHLLRPEVLQVLYGKTGTALRYSSTLHEDMLYVALPIERNGKIIAILRTSLFLKDINNLLHHIQSGIFRITAVAVLLSLLITFLLSRSITRPLVTLADAARKVAGGDFNAKVFLKSNSEIRELGDNFNFMTGRVSELFAQLSRREQELDAIISSIQEGLFVCDSEGRIRLCNRSFERMAGGTSGGKFYWETLRDRGFKELMDRVHTEAANITRNIELNGKTYRCNVSPLSSGAGFVAVLHDITQPLELEKMKKDFVSNVSHELRTPLTAIAGFIETLEDTANEENRHYLEIIKRHTARLKAIVEDLLTLSEMEYQGYILDIADVELSSLIRDMTAMFEERMKEKGLVFTLSVPEGNNIHVKGDRFKLEQVMINLLDNAVKYTDKGEIKVTAAAEPHTAVITVEDTGIGIPAEHLHRIYERFYVVDKSRSKKSGGTGLGLSIVKHILLLHNGSIKVESAAGRGTRFIIRLPA